jgi:hypothetical protein
LVKKKFSGENPLTVRGNYYVVLTSNGGNFDGHVPVLFLLQGTGGKYPTQSAFAPCMYVCMLYRGTYIHTYIQRGGGGPAATQDKGGPFAEEISLAPCTTLYSSYFIRCKLSISEENRICAPDPQGTGEKIQRESCERFDPRLAQTYLQACMDDDGVVLGVGRCVVRPSDRCPKLSLSLTRTLRSWALFVHRCRATRVADAVVKAATTATNRVVNEDARPVAIQTIRRRTQSRRLALTKQGPSIPPSST